MFIAIQSSPEAHEKLVSLQNTMFDYQILMFKQAATLKEMTHNTDIDMMADYLRTMMRGLIYSWMLDFNFNIVKRTYEFADIHVPMMFKNSHVYDQTCFEDNRYANEAQ